MHVTVIAPDKVVLVDGSALKLPNFDFDETLHAIQFDGQEGQIEFETPDGGVTTAPVTELEVQPYVEAWNAEKARLEAIVPPPLTLDEARTAKQRQIAAAHDAFLKSQSVEYSEMERQTWDSQRTESQALLADPQAAAQLVRAIANARGMDVIEMARRIQENTQAWSVLAGHATGQRLKYQDALEACTTVEQVEAISISFTTPE
ncbi:hypothetical protein ACQ0P8_06760 [Halodesulfovibrio aestuarii]|nr:hypothetical protein [Halodesulfovibrio aestuarii]